MDIQKQIDYWIENAVSDLETAELLIKNDKFLHGLFFCHLVIEKILKANVVNIIKDIPPKSHNLIFLLEKTDLKLSEDDSNFLGLLMKFQLEGRYPDYKPDIPIQEKVLLYLNKTKQLFQWLKKKL